MNLPAIGQMWPGTSDKFATIMPGNKSGNPWGSDYALLFSDVLINMATRPAALDMVAGAPYHTLPTVQELRVLHAIMPEHFELGRWYWSCQPDPMTPGLAFGAWIERNPEDGAVHCTSYVDNESQDGVIILVRRVPLNIFGQEAP